MVYRDGTDRRQVLIGLRRKVVPNVAGNGIGCERAAGVRFKQCDGDTHIGRKKVVLEEIVSQHNLPHFSFELIGLRPLPVFVPTS